MVKSNALTLARRPRRNRRSAAIRHLTQETRVEIDDLIQPLFVREGRGAPEPVKSMPGVFRFSVSDLVRECRDIHNLGISAVAIFPCISPKFKDERGSYALSPDNLLFRALAAVKKEVPALLIIADVALDPYTSHGHDGLVDPQGDISNDETVNVLAKLAVLEAGAGADWVAPSDMMDGRVGAIRKALDRAGRIETGILAYSAKFASSYYAPFRDAVGSSKSAGTSALDKRTYQLNSANTREALLEARLDEEEGADVLMVKPAGPYLDVIHQLRSQTQLPIAAYQVSGEYAQIHAAAQKGWLELEGARDESLLAIRRAGADMILTYFAKDVAANLRKKN